MDAAEKVQVIFRELAGDRAARLKADVSLTDSIDRIATALQAQESGDEAALKSQEIGFHLMDWQSDAAFLVAVALFPERFTDEEIQDGIGGLLVHAPHHILQAARQGGFPTDNIFKG